MALTRPRPHHRSYRLRCLERRSGLPSFVVSWASSVFPERRESSAETSTDCTQQRLVPPIVAIEASRQFIKEYPVKHLFACFLTEMTIRSCKKLLSARSSDQQAKNSV